MKIKELEIKGVGCIHNLCLSFNDDMNILCGPNSIGKTTVIESVASMFIQGNPTVKRNVNSDTGSIKAKVDVDGDTQEKTIEIKKFTPHEPETTFSFSQQSAKVLSMKVGRYFGYSRLDAVPSDRPREPHELWHETVSGVSFDGVKGWFVNRYLYSKHKGALPYDLTNISLGYVQHSPRNSKSSPSL